MKFIFEPWWAQARARFDALQPRERQMIVAASIVVAAALLYFAAWLPAQHARQRQAQALADARAQALELAALAPAAERARRAPATRGGSISLLAAVDQASRDGTLPKPPTRLQPDGDQRVRLWFEDVPFDALLSWLQKLQNSHGIRVEAAEFQRKSTPGVIDARLVLVRGQ